MRELVLDMILTVEQVLALEETLDPNWKSNVSLGF